MNIQKPISIIGMGKCLPANKVCSHELEEKLHIPKGWAERYSGVKERYHRTEETSGYLGARALVEALNEAGIEFHDLDLLICGSATFDYVIPNQACVIKAEVAGGMESDVPALNLDTTCLSFVSGIDMAAMMMDGKRYQKIAVVSVEISSNGLNPENWETATLFGDGAAAAVLSWEPEKGGRMLHALQETYSEGAYNTQLKGGGNQYHFKDYPYNPELYSFAMEGRKLLKMAKTKIPEFMANFFASLDIEITDIDLIIPHQASRAGIAIFRNMYDFKKGQIFENLETHGNCIAASIPMALYDAIQQGKLKRGDTCLISGTSAGFSIGGVLFRY